MPADYSSIIQSYYVSFYGRPADPDGLAFWVSSAEQLNGDLSTMLSMFGVSDEADTLFGDSASESVSRIFQQTFGRTATAEEIAQYSAQLAAGETSLPALMQSLTETAQGSDAAVFQARTQVAMQFVEQLTSGGNNFAGSVAADVAQSLLSQITASTDIESFIADNVQQTLSLVRLASEKPDVVQAMIPEGGTFGTLLDSMPSGSTFADLVSFASEIAQDAESAADVEAIIPAGGSSLADFFEDVPAGTTIDELIDTVQNGGLDDLGDVVAPPSTGGGGGGTPADTTAPAISSAVVNSDGNIELTYTEDVSSSVVERGDYRVTVGSSGETVDSVSVAGNKVTIVMDSPIDENAIVNSVEYVSTDGAVDSVVDAAGNAAADQTITTITNNSAQADSSTPYVTDVDVPSNGTYGVGETLSLTVNFSEIVTVDTSSGTPAVRITLGSGAVNAGYVSGSGSTSLVFEYDVQASDSDTDGIAVAASINLDSGTIEDAAGNSIDITLNNTGTTTSVLVDAVAPLLSSSTPADNATNMGINQDIVLSFDENIAKGTGNITIQLSSDGTFIHTIDVADPEVVVSGSTVTISHDGLSANTGYYVNIDSTAFTDTAGNAYAGISTETALNFSTAAVATTLGELDTIIAGSATSVIISPSSLDIDISARNLTGFTDGIIIDDGVNVTASVTQLVSSSAPFVYTGTAYATAKLASDGSEDDLTAVTFSSDVTEIDANGRTALVNAAQVPLMRGGSTFNVSDTLANLDNGAANTADMQNASNIYALAGAGADVSSVVMTGIDYLVLNNDQNYTVTVNQSGMLLDADGTGMESYAGSITIKDTLENLDNGAATTCEIPAYINNSYATVATGADISSAVVTDIDKIILTNNQNYTVAASQYSLLTDADGTGMESYAGILSLKASTVGTDLTSTDTGAYDRIILTNDQNYTVTGAQAAVVADADGTGMESFTGTITVADTLANLDNGAATVLKSAGVDSVTAVTGTSDIRSSDLADIDEIMTDTGGSITVKITAEQADGLSLSTTTAASDKFIVYGSSGSQSVTGSDGDDIFVLVGTTAAGQYSGSDALFDDLTSINGNTVSDVQSGEYYNGGNGLNVLHIYGTVDMTGVTLVNFSDIIVHSDVTFTENQIGEMGASSITGDGGSTVRFADDVLVNDYVNLNGISLTNIGQIDVGDDVKLIASQANFASVSTISSGFTNSVIQNAAGGDLSLTGKNVFGDAVILRTDGSTVTAADISSAAGVSNLEDIITSINTMIGATDGSDGGTINNVLVSTLNVSPQALVVLSDYELTVGDMTADNVLQGRPGVQNFIAGGTGSDIITGYSSSTNFIYGGAEATTNGTDINNITGGDQRDFIAGGNDTDIINAGSGDDFVAGGTGNDTINGNTGTDFLHGGDGDDTITGGTGDDFIDVGDGTDTLVIGAYATDGCDYVLNFAAGDRINFFDATTYVQAGTVAGADITAAITAAATALATGNGGTTVSGAVSFIWNSSQFVYIDGGTNGFSGSEDALICLVGTDLSTLDHTTFRAAE